MCVRARVCAGSGDVEPAAHDRTRRADKLHRQGDPQGPRQVRGGGGGEGGREGGREIE